MTHASIKHQFLLSVGILLLGFSQSTTFAYCPVGSTNCHIASCDTPASPLNYPLSSQQLQGIGMCDEPDDFQGGDINGGTYSWQCISYDSPNTTPGYPQHTSVANCSVAAKYNGVCGSTHGTTVSFTPSVNLCSVGTATTVLGSGPYFWSCVGADGGSTASCNALYQNSCTSYTDTNYTNNITRQTNEISAKLGTIEGETATPFTVTDSILQSDYNKLTLIGNILNSTSRLVVRIKNLNTDTQMIQYKNEATQNFYGCNAALWPVSLRGIVSDDLSDQSDAKVAQIIAGGGGFGGGLSYFNAFITSIQRVVNIFSPTERFFARETPAGFSVSCMVCTPPTTTVVGNLCTTQPNHPDCWLNGAGGGRTAQSFIKGTTVTMADGSLQAVENIQLGDKVKTSGGRGTIIKKHIYNTTANIYRMNTNHYFVTASHPFRTTEGWKSFDPETTRIKVPSIETNLLQSGDILIKENGDYEILTNTDYLTGLHTVHNFSVDSTHDFYANGYRVHNK